MRIGLFVSFLVCSTAAHADGISVQFADGAPKDSLTFQNTGCPLIDATIVIDLRGTAGGLIFDVTGQGAGVSVYQPIETQSSNVAIAPVVDGDQVLHLIVSSFGTGETISLTADLDDTLAGSQITVTGSEIAGATVTVASGAATQSAPFDSDGSAALVMPTTADGCMLT